MSSHRLLWATSSLSQPMDKPKPLAIELFAGLHGWGEGFAAEGFRVVGFDLYDMPKLLGLPRPEGDISLVLQNVLTIHGSQFKNATVILASPPCPEYSFMAQPWSRAKQIARALRGQDEFPAGYTGSRTIEQLNALFNACFRIQREACEAAGHYIPMVVENVKGAQPWVGRAKGNYGSFYLWGDVDTVNGSLVAGRPQFGAETFRASMRAKIPGQDWSNFGKTGEVSPHWNMQAHNGLKVPGMNFHEFEKTGKPGRSFQSAAVEGLKNDGGSWFNVANNTTSGVGQNPVNGTKGTGGSWFTPTEDGRQVVGRWRDSGCETRKYNSKSSARKAASAKIAKIPPALASYLARAFKP